MKTNKLETAVNEINDCYIDEAMTFKKASVMPLKKVSGIAAVALAFIIIGTVGVVATVRGKELKKVTVETQSVWVGRKPVESSDPAESDEQIVDMDNPDERIEGDEDTNWISKSTIELDGLILQEFVYDDISKALNDYKCSFYLEDIPGGEFVEAKIRKDFTDDWYFLSKSLTIQYCYKGGDVYIEDTSNDIDYYEIVTSGETANPREYVNSAGVNFTIVDDTGSETRRFVLISYDNHTGFIWFENLDDEQIHEVLDLVVPQ